MTEPKHILITGASGGIGRALALEYAAPGMTLSLGGRNEGRLEETAASCRTRGAEASTAVCDVRDAEATARWIANADARQRLDLVIANAGISGGPGRTNTEDDAQTRAIFETNLGGVINTVLPAVSAMRPRKTGQIAVVASLAGFFPIPGAPAYSASKAAVIAWGEALHGQLKKSGLSISVICPGFIATPMTDTNPFPMPFLMSPEKAARIIRRALIRRPPYVAFPWPTALVSRILRLIPTSARLALLARAPKKPPTPHE